MSVLESTRARVATRPVRSVLESTLLLLASLFAALMLSSGAASAQDELDLLDQLEVLQALEAEIESVSPEESGAQPASGPSADDATATAEAKARESALKGRLQEQLDYQAELLHRSDGGAGSPTADEVLYEADPRAAPRPPVERELPASIFDSEEMSIPPGEWGNARRIKVIRLTLDADEDGKPEAVRWVDSESDLLLRQEEDRNYDGVTDSWSEYEWGEVISRVLDSNDDGNPDVWERYAKSRMISRETDRDDDGVRDAFYKYDGESLTEERHDANNDGQIDLIILYENRLRTSAEEDQDRDGRMDTWTTYITKNGREVVSRIERDKRGEGAITIVEMFDAEAGEPVIARKDEDVNGDGEIDVVSIYRKGKLVRREISDPHLVEL